MPFNAETGGWLYSLVGVRAADVAKSWQRPEKEGPGLDASRPLELNFRAVPLKQGDVVFGEISVVDYGGHSETVTFNYEAP